MAKKRCKAAWPGRIANMTSSPTATRPAAWRLRGLVHAQVRELSR